jgi:hypothetical protein
MPFSTSFLFSVLVSRKQQNLIIDYHIPESAASKKRLFREGPRQLPAGSHSMSWQGSDLGGR